jgi:hypothetical protein
MEPTNICSTQKDIPYQGEKYKPLVSQFFPQLFTVIPKQHLSDPVEPHPIFQA